MNEVARCIFVLHFSSFFTRGSYNVPPPPTPLVPTPQYKAKPLSRSLTGAQ